VLTEGALSFLAELVQHFNKDVLEVQFSHFFFPYTKGACASLSSAPVSGLINLSHFGSECNVPQLYRRRAEVQTKIETGTYQFEFSSETAQIRKVSSGTV
jgi:hypothetical protein